MDDWDAKLIGSQNPTAIASEKEKSKEEYSVNGISVKDLLATKSTLSREEINWMISALENCKIHGMGVAKLLVGGNNQGFCGASIVSERNLVGVFCHFIRCIDLNAFSPLQSTMVEQQLHPSFSFTYEGQAKVTFTCKQRYITLHFKDNDECKKFYRKVQACLNNLDPQTTTSNAVSKLKVDNPGVADPALASTIREAELQRAASQPKKGAFLADGLADIIAQAREESAAAQQGRNKRNAAGAAPRRKLSAPAPPQRSGPGARGTHPARGSPRGRGGTPNRGNSRGGARGGRGMPRGGAANSSSPSFQNTSANHTSVRNGVVGRDQRASTLPTAPSRAPAPFEFTNRGVEPRESRIMKWQQKVERPIPGRASGDIIVKIQMVRLGAMKTMKFDVNTLIYDAIERAAKQCAVQPAGYGLYRRSGLQLDPDQTFSEQDVISNDILEFR